MSNQHLNKVWHENPEYIRRFYENIDINEKLCQEVKFILSTEIRKLEIEIAQISSRAKSLDSFCEKISRKSYKNPFDEVTDFAGVRVVYLYTASRPLIEKVIENEFEIIEKVDKVIFDDEKFGYGALHYLVKLKSNHAGARYDELKNKVCEIQVRTILQDVWALVAHHLSYKQESDVPKKLRRKLNALSGLFETADDQFENIRNARLSYTDEVRVTITGGGRLPDKEEANIDNLEAYLKTKFPDRQHDGISGIAEFLGDLKNYGYSTLSEIDEMLNVAIDAVHAEEAGYPPLGDDDEDTLYSTVGLARTALVFVSEKYLNEVFSSERAEQVEKFRHLLH